MERKKASDFHPEVLSLFDQYVHGLIDRRGFLARAAKFAVGGMTAGMLLDALNPQVRRGPAGRQGRHAAQGRVPCEFDSPQGSARCAATSRGPPRRTGKLPGVLVVHENRGLNPHIEDIARRLALENFVAFAPDALTPLGGYPGDEDKARELFAKLDQAKTREDFLAAAGFLKKRPECNGKVGAVGFCYGGGMVNFLATRVPELAAACPSTAASRRREDVPKIKAPLLHPLRGERRPHQRRHGPPTRRRSRPTR